MERTRTTLHRIISKLQKFVSVLIVAGSKEDAEQTRAELQKAGVRGHYTHYFGGFIKFIKYKQSLGDFLSTQVSQIV
jgi:hypothetical protein